MDEPSTSFFQSGLLPRNVVPYSCTNAVPLLDVTAPCQDSADALDAVLCLFSAKAAADGLAVVDDPAASERKGWIAVHPRMTNE